MNCPYCDSLLETLPGNRVCPHCTGPLDARWCREFSRQQADNHKTSWSQAVSPPKAVPRTPQPGIVCCPRCRSVDIQTKPRGFSWTLGCLGFFLLPVVGLLLGCIGANTLQRSCKSCSHRW